jgi:hypothetical protein
MIYFMKRDVNHTQSTVTSFRRTLIIAVWLLIGVSCRATHGPPPGFDGEWSPRELLMRSVRAYGGPEAVLDFKDLSYECEITVKEDGRQVKGKTHVRFKPPDRLFFTSDLEQVGKQVVLSNGRESLEFIDGAPTGRDVKADLERRRRLTMIHAFFLEDEACEVEMGPLTKIEGRLHAVLSKRSGVESWKLWIDLDELLVRRIRLLLPSGNGASSITGPLSVEWRFMKFKKAGKRLVPHAFRILMNGRSFQEGRITKFRMDQGLTDEDFRVPSS